MSTQVKIIPFRKPQRQQQYPELEVKADAMPVTKHERHLVLLARSIRAQSVAHFFILLGKVAEYEEEHGAHLALG